MGIVYRSLMLFIVVGLLTACGGGTTPRMPGNDGEASIDRAALDSSQHAMLGGTNGWFAGDPKPNYASRRTAQSYYGHANAGIGGLSLLPFHTAVTNLVAQHTIYHGAEGGYSAQLKLLRPVAAQIGDVLLYAPTMHAPNGACLEAGTAYYNGGAFTNYQTHMYLFSFDFCGGGGRTLHPDTVPNWFATYVRKSADGFPQYTVQICNCVAPNVWSQRYYNFIAHRFDTFYTTKGMYTGFGLGGWTQFETQYNVAQGSEARCSPNLPPVEESYVRYYTARGVAFINTGDTALYQPEPGENSFSAYGTCFNHNVTPASYRFTLPYSVRYVWRVVSTGY